MHTCGTGLQNWVHIITRDRFENRTHIDDDKIQVQCVHANTGMHACTHAHTCMDVQVFTSRLEHYKLNFHRQN